jgi:uncharacterized protein YecE (DUF72 family)
MATIKIACAGYPVGQKKYQAHLNAVELIQMFDALPRATTLDRWKETAETGFEFIACAPEAITHPCRDAKVAAAHRFGYFQDTPEVHGAYRQVVGAATALGARTVFFKLAPTMSAHADQVDRLTRFFKKVDRQGLHFAWEPPASWPANLITSVSAALRLFPAYNPLGERKTITAPLRYFRMGAGGRTGGVHRFSNEELASLKRACGPGPAYVVFNNGPYAFEDALRFSAMI